MKLFMVVTADEFELPVMVTDKATKVAEMFDTTTATIYLTIINRYTRERNYRIVEVFIDEDEI